MEIPKTNLDKIISGLISNNNAFFEMSKDFPEIAADLTTFKHNPNCSCKNKVVKFFTDKIDAGEKNIFDKYLLSNENLKNRINKIIKTYGENLLSGKIIVIENSPEAWSTFAAQHDKKIYRNFAILEKENKIHIYFL